MTATASIAAKDPALDAVAEFLLQHPTGSRFTGGFIVDRAPFIPNAVLIVAPKSTEIYAPWKKTMAHLEALEVDGVADFRAMDRFDALLCFTRLGQRVTTVPDFQEGGAEAFEREYYWTGETCEFVSDYAWYQHFGRGGSDSWLKDSQLRGRAVRIFRI